MVVGISKRQQLRNERALQDLIRSVPGNDRCADCQAMNPGWASWNMGLFLCMRCAALHRKLGTHISKVKSLSMDSWSDDQVDNMKSHGNNLMNKIYNPKNVKPPVPTDVDESDACMERFIRQKYQFRSLESGKPKPPSRHDSGYDRSPEGSPPPLPPKPNKPFGFGLRSASSATNLNRIAERQGSPPPPLPTSAGVQSRVASTGDASFESKLAVLRSMGFSNERRNAGALRGLDGNLDKAIDTLMKLGEGGNNPTLRPSTSTQGAAPASGGKSTNPFDQLDSKPPAQPSGQSYNPFDMPPAQPQLPAQPASAQPLDVSFQNLQVSQPLFPHSTGGYPQSQPVNQSFYQQSATPPVPSTSTFGQFVSSPQTFDGGNNNPFLQPPGPQQHQTNSYPPAAPAPQTTVSPTNPFFSSLQPQATGLPQSQPPAVGIPPGMHPPRHANTMPALSSTSPFGPSPFQQPQQQQPQPQLPTQLPTSQPSQGSLNPYQNLSAAPPTPQSAGYPAPPSQPQPGPGLGLGLGPQYSSPSSSNPGYLAPQPTGRAQMDKNSILSLYQFSPPPSAVPEQAPFPQQSQPQPQPQQPQPQQLSIPTSNPSQQLQSPTSPLSAGSRNPFFGGPAAGIAPGPQLHPPQQAQPQQAQAQSQAQGAAFPFATAMKSAPSTTGTFPRSHSHMSQQSVDISGLQNGRHSPDAFASLSSRYG